MLPIFISLLYSVSIVVATFVLIVYKKILQKYIFVVLTLIGIYSLGKWLILKLPTIQMGVGVSFGEALLFGLLLFGFIVLPFFNLFEKYIINKKLEKIDIKKMLFIFICFLILHSIPEAIQIGYQYTFNGNGTLGEVLKAIVEEIPEFILLLTLYIIATNDNKTTIYLGIMTGLLFPITTLLVSVFATTANTALEMMSTNILLGFYIIFGIMSFNLLLKYNKIYLIFFILGIILVELFKTYIGI